MLNYSFTLQSRLVKIYSCFRYCLKQFHIYCLYDANDKEQMSAKVRNSKWSTNCQPFLLGRTPSSRPVHGIAVCLPEDCTWTVAVISNSLLRHSWVCFLIENDFVLPILRQWLSSLVFSIFFSKFGFQSSIIEILVRFKIFQRRVSNISFTLSF